MENTKKEPSRDWNAIEAYVKEYVEGYEMHGEDAQGREANYTPNERETLLIQDAIIGLLGEDEFDRLYLPKSDPNGTNEHSGGGLTAREKP